MEQAIYVAVTGTQHCFGTSFVKPGQVIRLVKEPDNMHDHEAIKAVLELVGKIGYVANSTHTVPRGCFSAGRIYDRFADDTFGVVRFVVKDTVIVELATELSSISMFHAVAKSNELAW